MGKIKVKDANGNGRLDWFDVIIYWGTLGLNTALTVAGVIQSVAN